MIQRIKDVKLAALTFCHDQAKEELGDFLQDLLQGLKDEELEQMHLDYQKRSIDARREVPRILGT